MATQVYDGEIGSRRRCEKKSKEGRKGCVELSVYLLGQRAANSRGATVFYDWEPTEAIIALERLKRKVRWQFSNYLSCNKSASTATARFIHWLLVDEKFCRELKACARCVFIVERSSALRVARFKVVANFVS